MQIQLINLLLKKTELNADNQILNVSCEISDTSQHLTKNHEYKVTDVIISERQIKITEKLTKEVTAAAE